MNEKEELRKFCVEKAVEIFSWKNNLFFQKGKGPLELANVIYHFITEGKVEEFVLPGTRQDHIQ